MAQYSIESLVSGMVYGPYEAESPREALDALALDAGYQSYADAVAQTGHAGEWSIRIAVKEEASL